MSTITDVAKAAGVSVATVSRALRGLDRVSPETRERVRRAAEELNFVASPTATSLVSGRTRVVAVVAPFLTRWFFSTLVSAIDRTLRAQDHHVLLFDLEDDRFDRRRELTRTMLWKRVDGLISLNVPFTPAEMALLDRLRLPHVSIGTLVPGRPIVRIDDAAAARVATQHVIGLGHTRIAYVGVVSPNVALAQVPQYRLDSFRATLDAHGLEYRPDWTVGSDWTADAAARDIDRVLAQRDPPTAVVAASDEMAVGVLQAARRRGIPVPERLSVVGIDDFYLAGVMDLTTVRQNVSAQGATAATMLLALLDDEPADAVVIMPTQLVIRGSTGPATSAGPASSAG
ncbi:Transcriptional regulator involved in degradation (LacI family protein) [Nostocoides japonicum T1-X7]|uniref:Transcriptional regulator involved in degradation (LacI family protein) n=1 Tax=Nostocoides japonicum T1-X7 TaxID=1194083 RepID=A0A077LYN2_9MICO|nr:LacI family DNA-binding transcriptional regulator [Tetrasphaera japonica]CCH77084.1 Transcriptional regulator involved in degradation (LacI family protein) [Tetrasphaera japonica T1-X7]